MVRAAELRSRGDICRAKIEISTVVHGPSLKDGYVHGIEKAPVIIRHLSQVQRYIVATACVVFPAVVGLKMPAEEVEMLAFRIVFDHSAGA
jgi:hypothetical protein